MTNHSSHPEENPPNRTAPLPTMALQPSDVVESSNGYERIGPYEILEKLGEGGMGIVFVARQENPRRKVALKMIKAGRASGEALRRFQYEAQVLGRLRHPGIAQVYEAGTVRTGSGEQPYFAMEYIEGRGLSEVVAGLSLNERLHLFVQLCKAVQFAHQRGYIHRDLKPGNILVDEHGEPRVLDFGLARATGSDLETTSMGTDVGQLLGTVQYMSPEQCVGDPEALDARSDVYALGVILFELLSGHLPYDLSNRPLPEALRVVREEEPSRLSSTNRALRGDLETIALKALEKERERRYKSAADLGEDVLRYLQHEPILARRPSTTYQLAKFARRHKGLVGGSIVAVLALIAGTGLSIWKAIEADRERNDAVAAKQLADKKTDEAETAERKAEQRRREADSARKVAEKQRDEILRLSDTKRLEQLQVRAEALWPRYPDKIKAMETWLREAISLAANLEEHRISLAELRKQGVPVIGGRKSDKTDQGEERWRFNDTETQWRHDVLAELVSGLHSFVDSKKGLLADVGQREVFAREIEASTVEKYDVEWEEAIASIANEEECPAYRGFKLKPQIGLVPIGRDQGSGLWEFADIQTGEIPERGEDGKLVLTEESGLVVVLIPGGTFSMGAQKEDQNKPNYDPQAGNDEGPVQEVTLDPFFLSKYEMAQGQWERFAGNNPSYYQPPNLPSPENADLHPVEQVSWNDCDQVLSRLGFFLPTEAQWEYAARAGTTTAWWTGSDRDSLMGATNLADQAAKRAGATWAQIKDWPELDDGFATHAPIGSYRANGFGLHDVHGNVWEWCRDGYGRYGEVQPGPGDTESLTVGHRFRVFRGGSFDDSASAARSASRSGFAPEFRDGVLGVRPSRLATD